MFLYMQDNVLRRSGKCCGTVRGMFLCGEDFDSEDGFIDFSKLTLFIGGRGAEISFWKIILLKKQNWNMQETPVIFG